MTWPARNCDTVADFTSDSAGASPTVIVAVDPGAGGETTADPSGAVPAASAVSVTRPASTSAWVRAYVAVQIVCSPGARVVTGQLTTGGVPVPVNMVSATSMP